MDVKKGQETVYADWRKKNSDRGYNRAVFRFASRWADLLEGKIKEGGMRSVRDMDKRAHHALSWDWS